MQGNSSDHELWKLIPQTAYYLVAIIAALWALVVYRRNRRLEQSRWLSTFYEKFYENEKYKRVRELLDSQKFDDIRAMVEANARISLTISTSLSMWLSSRVRNNCEPMMLKLHSAII